MMIFHIYFIRPAWLMLLPMVLAFILFLRKRQTLRSHWEDACDPHLLKHLLTPPSRRSNTPSWLFACLCLFAIIALSGPSWTKQPQPVFSSQTGRLFLLDTSPNMDAKDLLPSRLSRARFKLLDILQRPYEGYTGLIAFTSQAFVVSPLTDEASTVASFVPQLRSDIMPLAGSNIAAALKQAHQLFQRAHFNQGDIYLLTSHSPTPYDLEVAQGLRKKGFRVSVLGIGTRQGAPIPEQQGNFKKDAEGRILINKLPEAALAKLARAGGGQYVSFTNTDQDIQTLLLSSPITAHQTTKPSHNKILRWKDQGIWFIFPVIVLSLYLFRRNWQEAV